MRKLKVLIACEESQAVCIEFRKLGHEAYSCDLLDCSGGHPEWHIQGNVLDCIPQMYSPTISFFTRNGNCVSFDNWDLMIGFPPCTDLAVSGARWFKEKIKDGRQQRSIKFFMELVYAEIPRIAIENPIGIMSTKYKKPKQIIQPWQFGHGETKATCLWLKNLPKLQPTEIVDGREQKIWKMAPGPERAKLRSKTYQGIAKAMAAQWSEYILNSWNYRQKHQPYSI